MNAENGSYGARFPKRRSWTPDYNLDGLSPSCKATNVQIQRENWGDYPQNTFLVATSIKCPLKLSLFGCRPWLPLLQRAEQGKVPMQRAKTHDNVSSRTYQLMVVSIVFSSNIWPKGAGGGRRFHSSNLMRCSCSSCARSTHLQKTSFYAV